MTTTTTTRTTTNSNSLSEKKKKKKGVPTLQTTNCHGNKVDGQRSQQITKKKIKL